MKYRVSECNEGNVVRMELYAKARYRHSVRTKRQAIVGQAYQANMISLVLGGNELRNFN
jgi:hypothetical protein